MANRSTFYSSLSQIGDVIGKGVISGIFGTVAMTVSQLIEMKITNRGQSSATVKVGGEVLGVEPKGLAEQEKEKTRSGGDVSKFTEEAVESNEKKFGQLMHYGYGTSWGLGRSILGPIGIKGWPAIMIHFGAVWGTALIMLPSSGASQPITKWSPKQIAIDILHHAVYAVAAGWVYDGMAGSKK